MYITHRIRNMRYPLDTRHLNPCGRNHGASRHGSFAKPIHHSNLTIHIPLVVLQWCFPVWKPPLVIRKCAYCNFAPTDSSKHLEPCLPPNAWIRSWTRNPILTIRVAVRGSCLMTSVLKLFVPRVKPNSTRASPHTSRMPISAQWANANGIQKNDPRFHSWLWMHARDKPCPNCRGTPW